MYGFEDPLCRQCFQWEKIDEEILSFYKKMGQFRKAFRSALKEAITFLYWEEECVAYLRGNLLCVVNLSGEKKELKIEVKSAFFKNTMIKEGEGFSINPYSFDALIINQ